jgi:hypothetical protein
MVIKTSKNYHSKLLLTVFFASILFVGLGLSMNQVFAMGDATSTCPNRYDGPIVSFAINNGSNSFNPIANPGVTFNVNTASSYDVTFVIHTSNMSSQNNTSLGTTWNRDDVFGFADGHCVPDSKTTTILPNQDVTLHRTLTNPHPGYYSQSVFFATFSNLSNPVTYHVQWIDSSSTPQTLQAMTTSSSKIHLSWTTPANNGGSEITGYQIKSSTDAGSTWSTIDANTGSTTTTYSDTGLNPSTTYTYRVSAINDIGTSRPSNTATASTPSDVTIASSSTELVATAISSSQINLSWTAPADDGGSEITGYDVERSPDNGNTWYTVIPNTGINNAAYNDTGLSQSTTYTYRVSAINGIGTDSPSNTASATTSTTSGIVLNNIQSTSGSTTLSSNRIMLSDFDVGTGNNRLLVVGVSADRSHVNSITFGGMPLTKKVGSFYNNDAEFWYLENPTGNGAIVVTMNGKTSTVVGAYSFSGVNQTNPMPTKAVRHNVDPNSPTISLTTKFANDWVIDLPSINGNSTIGSSTCTQQWDVNMPSAITGASGSKIVPTQSVVNCKWTANSADFWDDVAIEIKALP